MIRKMAVVGAMMFGALVGMSQGARADSEQGFGGTVSCGGNYLNRMGGTEAHFSVYVLRNRNLSGDIRIDRIRFYSADGKLRYDSALAGFPTATNSILSADDQVLHPLQSAQYSLADWLGTNLLAKSERPGTTLIDWSAASRVAPPAVVHVRLARERNPYTGGLGAERSRAHLPCASLAVERGAPRHSQASR